MQPIEFYTDYRKYLSDFYSAKKKTSPAYSYRVFCRKAGLASPSMYREVVSGKRNLTITTINAFIKGLGISPRESRFFENLVLFNQAKTEDAKRKQLAILRGLSYQKPQRVIPIDMYEYYEKWYHPVIRELAVVIPWGQDYGVLAKSVLPPIKTAEARESIELLLRLGLLEVKKDGTYKQTDPNVTSGAEVNSLAVRQLNRNYAQLGLEAIDRFPPSERDISSVIIGIPSNKFSRLKQEIVDFRKRLTGIIDPNDTLDGCYSLVIEFFPVGKAGAKKDGCDAEAL
jgi:uncharacterized protein (TIGR02147 family)